MMSLKKFSVLALTLAASGAFAGAVPSYSRFEPLTAANFAGSGIPNNPVAIRDLAGGVTLGLIATPRFSSPALTNNGAGVYQAQTGAYDGLGDNLAKWNFSFYIGDQSRTSYIYKLFADFNPAAGNADSTYFDVSQFYLTVPDSLTTAGTIQNSENMGFGTDFAQFDPNANGQYGFVLAAFNQAGTEVGRSAILVNVGQVNVGQVPEPASLALVGVALLGVAGSMRRNRR